MNKFIKVLIIVFVFSFIGLYFSYRNGYYEKRNYEKKILTDEMIEEYENDLLNGVDVTKKDYIPIEHDYTNIYTKSMLSISKTVEKSIDSIIKYLFSKISNTINEEK